MKKDELLGVMYTTDAKGMYEFQVSYDEELGIMHYFFDDEQIYEEEATLSDEELQALKDEEENEIQNDLWDYYYSEYVSKCSPILEIRGYDLEY